MDDSRKRILVIGVLFAAVGLAYFGYQYFFKPEQHQERPAATATPSAAGREAPEHHGPTADPAARRRLRRTALVSGEGFQARIDNLGGGLLRYRLVGDDRFIEGGRPLNLVTSGPGVSPGAPERYEPFHIVLARLGLPDDLVWNIEQVSDREVRLTWEGDGLRIVRTYKAGTGPYQLWHTVRLQNTRRRPVKTRLEVAVTRYVRRAQEQTSALSFLPGQRSPNITQGSCVYDDETDRNPRGDLEDGPHGYGANDVHFAAVESSYFVLAAAAHGEPAARCRQWGTNFPNNEHADGTLFETRLAYRWDTIAPGQTRTWRTLGYLGPKDRGVLEQAGHRLSEVVDLGYFSLIAGQLANLLGFIHSVLPAPISNWGFAIILLTFLVRLVLFPLTNMSFSSMARMRQLKPEIDRINELYKDDAQNKGAAIMELYKKHKVNPMLGCLPMVAQMPVWFALYTSLSTNIELYHQPFALWWQDLTAPDPFFVLPLVLGVLMHVQQRITPSAMDPQQAKIMMWMMPVMITVFMLFLPAGLCLYMLTNSVLGIGQQKLNEWRLSRVPKLAETVTPGAPTTEPDEGEGPETDGGDDETTTSSHGPKRRPRRKRLKGTRRGRA